MFWQGWKCRAGCSTQERLGALLPPSDQLDVRDFKEGLGQPLQSGVHKGRRPIGAGGGAEALLCPSGRAGIGTHLLIPSLPAEGGRVLLDHDKNYSLGSDTVTSRMWNKGHAFCLVFFQSEITEVWSFSVTQVVDVQKKACSKPFILTCISGQITFKPKSLTFLSPLPL